MHLGHEIDPTPSNDALVSRSLLGPSPGVCAKLCLLVIADIVAFTTCTSGGLIPHAKHGGNGVRAFAVAGSKFEGTGFEKEHIGQTQVAFAAGAGAGDGVTERSGLPCLSGVVDNGLCTVLLDVGGPRESRLEGLG